MSPLPVVTCRRTFRLSPLLIPALLTAKQLMKPIERFLRYLDTLLPVSPSPSLSCSL